MDQKSMITNKDCKKYNVSIIILFDFVWCYNIINIKKWVSADFAWLRFLADEYGYISKGLHCKIVIIILCDDSVVLQRSKNSI